MVTRNYWRTQGGTVEIRPGVPELDVLAEVRNLSEDGRLSEAASLCRIALEQYPDHPETLWRLGLVRFYEGDCNAAIALFDRAIAADPREMAFLNSRGEALRLQGRFEESIQALEHAREQGPEIPEIHNNLGVAVMATGWSERAVNHFQAAIELRPEFAKAWCNLGIARHAQGRHREAIRFLRQALEHDPDSESIHSNLIMAMDHSPDFDLETQHAERRRWWKRFGMPVARSARSFTNDPDPDRRLRIGYVSADYRHHSAACVIVPIVIGHDYRHFEVYCYSGTISVDATTEVFRRAADVWVTTSGLPDDALADRIRADRINILVDLSGHSPGNRLLVFARKPAPVQVTGWGYATGTGLPVTDYFISDATIVPAADAHLFAEEVVHLTSHFTFLAPDPSPSLTPLPRLSRGFITFGSLNRPAKLSSLTYPLWARVLEAVPDARLILKSKEFNDSAFREEVAARLAGLGVDRARVQLRGQTTRYLHIGTFREVDIALDPVPHCGGVTALEGLWTGVPVVTLEGVTPSARLGASMMRLLGLPEFVAQTDDQYVEIAVRASRRVGELVDIRNTLRDRMLGTPIGDGERYVREVERFYRKAWSRWCVGRTR